MKRAPSSDIISHKDVIKKKTVKPIVHNSIPDSDDEVNLLQGDLSDNPAFKALKNQNYNRIMPNDSYCKKSTIQETSIKVESKFKHKGNSYLFIF